MPLPVYRALLPMNRHLRNKDMIGQVVYKGNSVVKDSRINFEGQLNNSIASGTYLLNVRSGAISKVVHIIIER